MNLQNIKLPEVLEEYIALTDTPREIMVGSFISFASSLMPDISVVSNACHAKYARPMKLNVFGCMVGDSSIGKSVAMRAPMDCAKRIRNKRREWYSETPFHNFAMDNITTAYLASYAGHYRNAMVLKDEMSGMFEALENAKASYGLTTDDLCSLFSQVAINKGTKGDGDENIDGLYVGLFGGIQPKFAYPFLREEKYLAQGFLQRFLFYYPEKANNGFTPEEALKDIVTKMFDNQGSDINDSHSRVVDYFERIYDTYSTIEQGVTWEQERDSQTILYTRRQPSTHGVDIEYLAHVEASRSTDPYRYAMWSKKFEIANRVSAILYAMHNVGSLSSGEVIPAYFFEQAIQIVEYSMSCLERLRREMEGEEDSKMFYGVKGEIMSYLYNLERNDEMGLYNKSSLHRVMSEAGLIDIGTTRFSQLCTELIRCDALRVEKRKLFLNTDNFDFASVYAPPVEEIVI